MIYQFNAFEIDSSNFTLKNNKENVDVEPRVFDLILYLIENRKKLVSRDELFDKIWNGRNVLDATLSNHIKIARNVLGDDGHKQQVIKTIHGRGYQFIAKVEDKVEKRNAKPKKIAKKNTIAAIIIATIIALALVLSYYLKTTNKAPKIAVLPFINNTPNPQTNYFGFAMADQIIGDLSYLQNISVRPSASIRKYIQAIVDPIAIGKEMEVDYILSGNYARFDGEFRLNIELVEVNSANLIWHSKNIKTNSYSTFELQDTVARQVIDALKVKFSNSEIRRIHQDISSNPLAYEYYLRSVAYPYSIDGNKLAIEMLKKSIELDANHALSYVQLGDRVRRYKQFSLQDLPYQTAEDYYNKALQLNPDLLKALAYLSMLYTETNRIEKAIVLVNKMLEINPTNANTHFTLGYIYRYTGMVEAAIDEMEKAVKLDPRNPKFRSLIGAYSGAGMYFKALKMTDLYKTSPFTLGWKGLMHRQLGHNKEAINYFNQVIKLDKDGLWANVATVFKSYMQEQYDVGLIAVNKLAMAAESDGETLYYLSSYYCLLGDTDNCLKTLKKAIDSGYYNYPFMSSNDFYKSIANNKDFISLLKKAQNKHLEFKELYF